MTSKSCDDTTTSSRPEALSMKTQRSETECSFVARQRCVDKLLACMFRVLVIRHTLPERYFSLATIHRGFASINIFLNHSRLLGGLLLAAVAASVRVRTGRALSTNARNP